MREEQTLPSIPHVVDRERDFLKRLGPVSTPSAWEVVADLLRRKIDLGAFLPGDSLPSERRLAEELGVSRVTVRDALRVLQGERLIETRRGASGGPQVTGPPARSIEQIQADLRQELPRLLSILDQRIAEETFAARLAALNPTPDEQLEVMSDSINEMKNALRDLDKAVNDIEAAASADEEEAARHRIDRATARYRREDSTFHFAIAALAGNPASYKTVERLRTEFFAPLVVVLHGSYSSGDRAAMVGDHNSITEHTEILKAIEAKNGPAAAEAVWEHLESTKGALGRLLGDEAAVATLATRAHEQPVVGGEAAWRN